MRYLFPIFCGVLLLSGCSRGIFSKFSPDEFAVSGRSPLVLPPDYEMRPPLPEGQKDYSKKDVMAKKALMGIDVSRPESDQTEAEKSLISKASSKDVSSDGFAAKQKDDALVSEIGEVTGEEISGYDETLDAEKEAKRLESEENESSD